MSKRVLFQTIQFGVNTVSISKTVVAVDSKIKTCQLIDFIVLRDRSVRIKKKTGKKVPRPC